MGAAAPVRVAHLGLGNFFRAHQAWYTGLAPDAEDWGIAAFTGRRAHMAGVLAEQHGLYTLVTRDAEEDTFDVVGSLSAVHGAAEHDAWLAHLRSPRLAVVTMTVTEAGYAGGEGGIDHHDPDVQADVAALRADPTAATRSVPGRLLVGLLARARADLGPVAVVPCDNLPVNGEVVAAAVRAMAERVDPALASVVDQYASFVTTMVDRITPHTTDTDRRTVLSATGMHDAAPVTTEPFSEWVISGSFPAGRPDWATAGATMVDDVGPFEERKLWLLNGGHSLLAYAGSVRGHLTVAEAVADEVCRGWLEHWWDEATRHLRLQDDAVHAYRASLLDRFANPRMQHLLSQIASAGSQKLPVRIIPVLRHERDAGRPGCGASRVLAGWIGHLRGHGVPVTDPKAEAAVAAAEGPLVDSVSRVVALLDPALSEDRQLVGQVVEQVREICVES